MNVITKLAVGLVIPVTGYLIKFIEQVFSLT